jgi:hypothetical protein
MKNFAAMTDAEISKRIHELSNILNGDCTTTAWDSAYSEYCKLRDVQDKRYRERNQEAFDAFYERFIKGKKWEEINDDTWSFYSDWHKDMYGYRPRTI